MKIVINKCYGGFSLSHAAVMYYAELFDKTLYPYVNKRTNDGIDFKMLIPYISETETPSILGHIVYLNKPLNKDSTLENDYFRPMDIKRNDPILVRVVQKLKKKANGMCADLKIITIPDDVDFEVEEYDGTEWVAEKHRTWS